MCSVEALMKTDITHKTKLKLNVYIFNSFYILVCIILTFKVLFFTLNYKHYVTVGLIFKPDLALAALYLPKLLFPSCITHTSGHSVCVEGKQAQHSGNDSSLKLEFTVTSP